MEDSNIQVCAVYVNGMVRVYDRMPKVGNRLFVKSVQFKTYGAALQFALAFEEKQYHELLEARKKK